MARDRGRPLSVPAGGAALPDDPALPLIPADESGPVFREPWEAQAFAVAVTLHQAGHFTWAEWVAAISAEIRRAQADGDPDLGRSYYRHWLAALEKIIMAKNLTDDVELRLRQIECGANAAAVKHGHAARRAPVRVV